MSSGRRSALGAIMGQVQRRLALDLLRTDERTQLRAQMSPQVLADYAERMSRAQSGDVVDHEGKAWPPIIVYFDEDTGLYLIADGHHRVEAAREAGLAEIQAEVRSGDVRAAILHAASANAKHGLPLSSKDKRRAVVTLLSDPEWREWADREIARRVGCSHPTVSAIRAELEAAAQIEPANVRHTARGVDMDIQGLQHAVPPKVRSKSGAQAVVIKAEAGELSELPLERAANTLAFEQLRAAPTGARVVVASWAERDDLWQLSQHVYPALGDGGALVLRAPQGELLSLLVLWFNDMTRDGRLLGPQIVVSEELEPLLVWTRGQADVPLRVQSFDALCAHLQGGGGRVTRIVSG